jgi:hypothetical protein
MYTTITSLIVLGCLIAAILLGNGCSSFSSERSLNGRLQGRDQASDGFGGDHVGTCFRAVGQLSKGLYDTERSEVIQMAAKVAFLDRVLTVYGPEGAEARTRFMTIESWGVRFIFG